MKCGIISENFLFMVLRSAVIFQQSASGKAQIISVDSREVVHNPLYKAFKTKNFSDYDILLHFCILDMLAGGKELAFRNIAGELQEYGFSGQKERKSSIILCRQMRLIWFPGRMQLNFSLKQSRWA